MPNSLKPFSRRVRKVVVDGERVGQRLDNFLIRELKSVPKSLVYRLVRQGQVRVNKSRAKVAYRIQAGDVIRIPPVSEREPAGEPSVPQRVAKSLRGAILYDANGLIVLNKPAGIAVHGGSGLSFGVIEVLRTLYPTTAHLELVHRLDRETSGCLLIASKRSVLRALHQQLRENDIKKTYWALLKGSVPKNTVTVRAPLIKNTLRSGERVVRVDAAGKPSTTRFRVLERFEDTTLVAAYPQTGRTHQIRVHALHLGHPIVGDEKYGDEAVNREMREKGLNRLFLHAETISVRLPGQNEPLTFSAPLDPVLAACLATLRAK